jgi:hypothetical protein
MRWAGNVACMEKISVNKSVIGKTKGNGPLGRLGRGQQNVS